MIDKNYNIPLVYQKMNERGYTNAQNNSYLWLNEMEWMPINKNPAKKAPKTRISCGLSAKFRV